MALFEIEQYEIHTVKFQVEAKTKAEAIARVFNGEATSVDDGHELVGVCEDLGMPVDEHRKLARKLKKLGVAVGGDVIPSIRSVERLE